MQTFTVHHTATGNDDPDPAARMRSIYRYQAIDLGYGDFGYHFLIDEAGRVYEGRWSGGDALPGFDPAGWMVNASHVGGYNAGNVGVVLLGNFMQREPTAAARRSLTLLLAALVELVPRQPGRRRRLREPDQRAAPVGARHRRASGLGSDRVPG
nr:hypothetical protein GCM10020092_079390 [Actinoplanes digitatis]